MWLSKQFTDFLTKINICLILQGEAEQPWQRLSSQSVTLSHLKGGSEVAQVECEGKICVMGAGSSSPHWLLAPSSLLSCATRVLAVLRAAGNSQIPLLIF